MMLGSSRWFSVVGAAALLLSCSDRDPAALLDASGLDRAREARTLGVSVAASSQMPGWAIENLADGVARSAWSSQGHVSPFSVEWVLYRFAEPQRVNHVRLRPRFDTGRALGFPERFSLQCWSGGSASVIDTHESFPAPREDAWIVLKLSSAPTCHGVLVVADILGSDGGQYVLQMGELTAGFEPELEPWVFQGNAATKAQEVLVEGLGAERFAPQRLGSFKPDVRAPLIAATSRPSPGPEWTVYRNLYSPSVVKVGPATYYVYIHGWDGVAAKPPLEQYLRDSIYLAVTRDGFDSFEDLDADGQPDHHPMVLPGEFAHVGNQSVVRAGPSDWRMTYTAGDASGALAVTGYARSSDGVHWTPGQGSTSALISMSGWPKPWALRNVNGGNPIIIEAGRVHTYLNDAFWSADPAVCSPACRGGIYHASSADGVAFQFVETTFDGFSAVPAMTDVKRIAGRYLYLLHRNTTSIRYIVDDDLSPLERNHYESYAELFGPAHGEADSVMITPGIVTDGERLMGVLYGASSYLGGFGIYARWLQRHVRMEGGSAPLEALEAFGPDRAVLRPTGVATGRLAVYLEDWDARTQRGTRIALSPPLTVRPGDRWRYVGR